MGNQIQAERMQVHSENWKHCKITAEEGVRRGRLGMHSWLTESLDSPSKDFGFYPTDNGEPVEPFKKGRDLLRFVFFVVVFLASLDLCCCVGSSLQRVGFL